MILGRLGELAAELDRLCRTMRSERQGDRSGVDHRTLPGKENTQPDYNDSTEFVATIEIIDSLSNDGNLRASERIVSAVLPGLVPGVTEVRVTCTIQYAGRQVTG